MPNSRMADAGKTDFQREPCGIIRIAALWVSSWHLVEKYASIEWNAWGSGNVTVSVLGV